MSLLKLLLLAWACDVAFGGIYLAQSIQAVWMLDGNFVVCTKIVLVHKRRQVGGGAQGAVPHRQLL